ncbi:Gram-positive signal peptide protein, YSIRK family [Streptococcus pseudoporcinus]|uniref:Gram-positive signal peptide protein, YSIRK family n=1 Tax=Streptococcus pseudoporcinus TaxID=361101 RepID=A0A4U9XJM4_9STRE|nr:Gram-positive signal peptide protein, YSIRK family [Streptococcus pseudoporcinus]VUC65337.1 Gram-positive signal peptide protein, YSIRK family [Streptococcus pseudoporcinus]VUC96189.1 Gram-positive signal peptide protein, YSIRK family [Streptococcus pseudoporcinus]VUC96585.1 Gram-positive signal peptide protein, YSIRK family [Streptococcus pseudoporcinus]
MGFKFEFLVKNKPTKILLTQVIGDIDLGQKITFDFGQGGSKLFSVPKDSKITNNNETFSSANNFNVQNFDKTPEGTMLAIGVGTEMSYHHFTEDSYYQITNTNYQVLSQLTEEKFDEEKLALIAGTSDAAKGEKRVGGILFSLFGNSVKLNEVVKPEPPVYETVIEPKAPTPPQTIVIEKPKLSLKTFNIVPVTEPRLTFDLDTADWPKESLTDPVLPENPVRNDSQPQPDDIGQDNDVIEISLGTSDFVDIFEDSATEMIGGSNTGALSIQENSDPIYEETYDSEPAREFGQSFLIEESEDTQFGRTGFSGDEIIEEESEMPVYQVGQQSEVVEFSEATQPNVTGFSGAATFEEDSQTPVYHFGMQSEPVEFIEETQFGMTGFSGADTFEEDSQTPVYPFGIQSELVEFIEDTQFDTTGFSGADTFEEDSETPVHHFGMPSESVEVSEETQNDMTGFSDDEEIEENTVVSQKTPSVEQLSDEEKPHFNELEEAVAPVASSEKTILPMTGEKEKSPLLAIIFIILSLLGIFSQTTKGRRS